MVESALIFLAVAFVSSFLFKYLGLGSVLAFLVTGIIVGPFEFGIFNITPIWDFLGQLGIMFLWFTMGLELNMKRLWSLRSNIFGFGGMQVLFVSLCLVPILFGVTTWAPLAIVMVALMLSMSSTSSDLQILAERNELQTNVGRQAFSILLFQDLLSIPLLAMIPVFAGKSLNLGASVVDILVMTAGLILGVMIIGKFVLNPLMRLVSKQKSPEASVLLVMCNIVFWAVVMGKIGLPPAMGAFLAGMLFSETVFRHQVMADIAPYKMIFLAFFFLVLGMNLNVHLLPAYWHIILAWVAGIFILKFLAIYIIGRIRGIMSRDSFEIALVLAQAGEFGLLMLQLTNTNGIEIIPIEDGQLLMVIIVASMMTTPILVKIYDFMASYGLFFSKKKAAVLNNLGGEKKATVAILGFGRVGQTIAKMLQMAHVDYVAIDLDADQVVLARADGFNAYYGDTTQAEVMRALGVDKVKVAVIALDNAAVVKRTVRAVRSLSTRITVFARARNLMEADQLTAQGVAQALPETIESSFLLGQEILLKLGIPELQVAETIQKLRSGGYSALATIAEKNYTKQGGRAKKKIKEIHNLFFPGAKLPAAAEKKKKLDDVILQNRAKVPTKKKK